jgi:serine/alanine racemase
LKAAAVATLLITFCLYFKIKPKTILIISGVLYLIGLLPQTYFGLMEPLRSTPFVWTILKAVQKLMQTTRNGIFEGFIFMALGMYYAYNPIKLKLKSAFLGFIISFIFLYAEYSTVNTLGWAREHDMYISLVPTVFFMLYIAVNVKLNDSAIYKHLRELSILIFYLHLIIHYLLSLSFEFLKINITNSLATYIATVVATIFVSEIILKISQKYTWLKQLY